MGCCHSVNKSTNKSIALMVKECIEKNDIRGLLDTIKGSEFIKHQESSLICLDGTITNVKLLRLNALAYSLFLGRSEIFQILHRAGCSLHSMEVLLESQGIISLTLMCCNGFSDILNYYLPFYNANHNKEEQDTEIEKSFTIDLSPDPRFRLCSKTTYTALQIAVQYEHLLVVMAVFKYFKRVKNVPFQLDLDYKHEESGENCALIACRFGNYTMMKFLHERCGANFMIKNKLGENAVQVAVAGSRAYPHKGYFEIISYLVEVVGIDLAENYEEVLILAEDRRIVNYLERKLKEYGIFRQKNEIENITPGMEQEDICSSRNSPQFDFLNMYTRNCGENEQSFVSSISAKNSMYSIFGSTISQFHK